MSAAPRHTGHVNVGARVRIGRWALGAQGFALGVFGGTGLAWSMAVSGWVPAGAMGTLMHDGDGMRDNRGAPMFRLMGRLVPGRSVADARAELEVITRRLTAAFPAEHKGTRVLVIPENRARPDPSVSEFLPAMVVIFLGMVGLVLFISCANVANLMIARALERQRDLVIRSALGASRVRLIRLQVAEGLVPRAGRLQMVAGDQPVLHLAQRRRAR